MEGFLQVLPKITFYMINSNYNNAMLITQFNYLDKISSLDQNKEGVGFWKGISIGNLEPFSSKQEINEVHDFEENKLSTCFFTEEELNVIEKMDEIARFSLKSLIF
jgi:hypothetical protein